MLAVGGDSAARSAAFSLVSEAMRQGSWGAVVGMREAGPLAAADLGIPLERMVFVDCAPEMAGRAIAALVDEIDVVLSEGWAPGEREARAIEGRVRSRGAVLVALGRGALQQRARLVLTARSKRWEGLGQGWGILRARLVEVTVSGRGAATAERRKLLWLPGEDGGVHEAFSLRGGIEERQVTAQARGDRGRSRLSSERHHGQPEGSAR